MLIQAGFEGGVGLVAEGEIAEGAERGGKEKEGCGVGECSGMGFGSDFFWGSAAMASKLKISPAYNYWS